MAVHHFRGLGQSPVRLRVVQAQPAIHRAAHRHLAPLRMRDERPPLDPLRQRATVGLALALLFRSEPMELPMMPDKRGDAYHLPIIRQRVSSNDVVRQHPGIETVRLPDLGQLLATLLQPQLLAQRFGLIALHEVERAKLAHFLVKPVLAYFQRGKSLVPTALPFLCRSSNVLYHKHLDWKKLAQEPS